jgi:hypothetical protein
MMSAAAGIPYLIIARSGAAERRAAELEGIVQGMQERMEEPR